jgi:hypothetical protein
MTVTPVFSALLFGVSTDTKPTTYPTDTIFYETDTGINYRWTGTIWTSMYGASTNALNTWTAGQTFNDTILKMRNPANTFSVTLSAGAQTADRTITLPVVSGNDTLSSASSTTTLINKTINLTNNTVTDTSTALGDIVKSNGTKFTRLARGTANQVLTVNSGGTDIAWATPAAGTASEQFSDSYTYTIYVESATVKARNNKTGAIDFTNANLDPVVTSIMATGDISLEIQSGTYNLSGSFAGWSLGNAATIQLQQDAVIKVPNAYTGYVWSFGSSVKWISIKGGRYEEQGTPASNWTCFKFQPAAPNGAFGNVIKDTVVVQAKYVIHLLTATTSWINGNLFENVYGDRCKYLVFFEHTSTFTAQTSGSNANNFIHCALQTAASSPQVLGGIANVNGYWNNFENCLIWDIAASNASAASLTLTANAANTTVFGGLLTHVNYSDSGTNTNIIDWTQRRIINPDIIFNTAKSITSGTTPRTAMTFMANGALDLNNTLLLNTLFDNGNGSGANMRIYDSDYSHLYKIGTGNITADRAVTIPAVTADDTFVMRADTATLTNKTLSGPKWTRTTITATSYTALDTDTIILCDTTSNAITINLPAASGRDGKFYLIHRKAGTSNTITIDPNGAETINGSATLAVATSIPSSALIYTDGTAWYSK